MDDVLGERIGQEVNRILTAEEDQLSCYIASSEVSKINNLASKGFVRVSEELGLVVDALDDYWKRTGGAFDAGLFNYTSFLKCNRHQEMVVTDDIYGWKYVKWNRAEREIRFLNEFAGIDVGGFGKGWVLDKIIRFLKSQNIHSAFLSFGESSISVIGTHPNGNCWPVTIVHPNTNVELSIELVDASISVSGLSGKASSDGLNFNPHIICPQNGTVIREYEMAVVKSASSVDAEVLSTAVLASGGINLNGMLREFTDTSFYICGLNDLQFKEIKVK